MPAPLLLGASIAGLAATIARYLVPYIIVKTCIALGLTITTFVGLDFLTDYLVDEVRASYSNLPANMLSIMAMAGAFDWIEVVLSSWVAAVQLKSLIYGFNKLTFGVFS